jgi:opacity protein-like surface antigen
MRSVLMIGVAMLGLTHNALAADPAEYDVSDLRGSNVYEAPAYKTYTRWSGLYAGGQVEYGSANLDFSKATQSLASWSLRGLALEDEGNVSKFELLDRKHTGSTGFGVFVGYNTQWEDIILGVELSYNKNSFSAVATNSQIGRTLSAGGNSYGVLANGAASLDISDYGEFRGRVGYVMGNFLPYATVGFAMGRADFTRAWSITGTENPGTSGAVPFSFSNSEAKNSALIYGWSIGAGLDVALWQNVFIRGEFDYVQFSPVSGIAASLAVGRVGGGVKF